MGGRTCQIESVCLAFVCFYVCFLFLVANMTLKALKFQKILIYFAETFWENILTYLKKKNS